MNAVSIELVGEVIDYNSDHKDWWKEHQKKEKFENSVIKKNALGTLQDVFKKMFEDGIHYIEIEFNGGHDEGGFDGGFSFYDKNGEVLKNVKVPKYSPTTWLTAYKPLKYEFTRGKQKIIQIFEWQESDCTDVKIDEDWLEQRFYDFGFLEEWGSFAGEFQVNGTVKVNTRDGSWKMPYDQTNEDYDSHEPEGMMFPDDHKVNDYGVVVKVPLTKEK